MPRSPSRCSAARLSAGVQSAARTHDCPSQPTPQASMVTHCPSHCHHDLDCVLANGIEGLCCVIGSLHCTGRTPCPRPHLRRRWHMQGFGARGHRWAGGMAGRAARRAGWAGGPPVRRPCKRDAAGLQGGREDVHAFVLGLAAPAGDTIDAVLPVARGKHGQQPHGQVGVPRAHHEGPPRGVALVQAHAAVALEKAPPLSAPCSSTQRRAAPQCLKK